MPFERPSAEERNERIGEVSERLSSIIEDTDSNTLERAIRFLGVNHREKFYRAVEMSKTATDDLMHKD